MRSPLAKAPVTTAARAPMTVMSSAMTETARLAALRVVFKVSFFTIVMALESGRK